MSSPAEFFSLSSSDLLDLSRQDLISFLGRERSIYVKLLSRKLAIESFYSKHVDKSDVLARGAFVAAIYRFDGVLSRLDNNNLIPNALDLKFFYSMPKTVSEHCFQLFNTHRVFYYYKKDGFLSDYLERLRICTVKARKSEIERRLILAVEDLISTRGWFCVFNTLTVDAEHYLDVFDRGSKAWRNYIENVDNLFGISAYGSVRKAKMERRIGNDFHQYFAVTERGSKSGRLHIHVLHFFKSLPDRWSDPNFGCDIDGNAPYRREISKFKGYWKYGNSNPVAVRFSQDDAFGKLRWLWPVECAACKSAGSLRCFCAVQGYQPIEAKPPLALMKYVAKYLEKEYHEDRKPGGIVWRAKLSRSLGVRLLTKVLYQIPLSSLRTILQSRLLLMHRQRKMPVRLARRLILRILGESSCRYGMSILLNALPRWTARKNIVDRVKDLIRKFSCPNPLSVGLLHRGRLSNLAVGFEVFKENLILPMGGVCARV